MPLTRHRVYSALAKKMKYQHRTLIASYGETMLYSQLVEDFIQLNLREAARFATNEYAPPGKLPQGLKQKIREYGKAFPSEPKFVAYLQKLRETRNKLTHALVPQVGSDLSTDEGRDQIQAMLELYLSYVKIAHKKLGEQYHELVNQTVKDDFTKIFQGDIEPIDGRVSNSEIQQLLEEIQGLL